MKCECEQKPRYRHRLTIQTPGGTPDASGHVDLTDSGNWDDGDSIKVNFLSKGGREVVTGQAIQAEVTHVVETPSTELSRSITAKMRLKWGTRFFNVSATYDVNEERKTVQIHLIEVV